MRQFCKILSLPAFGKSFAPSPVWRGSVQGDVPMSGMDFSLKSKLVRKAKRLYRGKLSNNDLAVYDTLALTFHNSKTGRLDPALETIAKAAGVCRDTAARSLKKLRSAGLIDWVRRCASDISDAGHRLVQLSNAYTLKPMAAWLGISLDQGPAPSEWGAAPVMPTLAEMVGAQAKEGHTGRLIETVGHDPANDKLAAALSRMALLVGS